LPPISKRDQLGSGRQPSGDNTKVILLVSVLITPDGVRKYRTGSAFDSKAPFARVSRFLTATSTLSNLDFDEIYFNYELAEEFAALYPKIDDFLKDLFKSPKISHRRLTTGSEWANFLSLLPEDATVALHSNDDHAFVGSARIFAEVVNLMRSEGYDYVCTTHFGEWLGESLRLGTPPAGELGTRFESREIIGTCLARAGFLVEVFDLYDRLFPGQFIPRPDNPFGPDLAEVLQPERPIQTFAPAFELFRHLDGYSHILAKRPLTPLCNTFEIVPRPGPSFEIVRSREWHTKLWPSWRHSAYCSILLKPDPNNRNLTRTRRFRVLVGYFVGYYSIAILPIARNNYAITWSGLSRAEVGAAKCIACLNPSVARNLPDLLIRLTFKALRVPEPRFIVKIGWFRTVWTRKRQIWKSIICIGGSHSKHRRRNVTTSVQTGPQAVTSTDARRSRP